MKKKRTLATFAKPITDFGAIICGIFVAVNIAIIFASVFMRYAFNKPILGTTELVALLMPFIAYFGIGYTSSVNGHVQMAAFYDRITAASQSGETVSITNVTELVDRAMKNANKFFRRIGSAKKRYDEEDRIILQEKDFR